MANAMAGFPRYTEEAVFTSPATFAANYPVGNAGKLPLTRVARTEEKDDLTVIATFPQRRLIELCALGRHNIIINEATMRWRLYDEPTGGSLLHDSGEVKVWPQSKTEAQVTWDSGEFWDRGLRDDEKRGYPWYAPYLVPGMIYARRVELSVKAAANPEAIDIGLIELAAAFRFPVNFGVGAQYGFKVRSTVIETEGGSEYFNKQPSSRVFQGEIPVVKSGDAKAGFYEFKRQTGITEPFLFWLNPDDSLNTLRECFMARNADLPLDSYVTHDLHSIPLNLTEFS